MSNDNERRTSFGDTNKNAHPSSSNIENETEKNAQPVNGGGTDKGNQDANKIENTSKQNPEKDVNSTGNNTENKRNDLNSSKEHDGDTINPNEMNGANQEDSSPNNTENAKGKETDDVANKDDVGKGSGGSDKQSLGDKVKDFAGDADTKKSAINVLNADNKSDAIKEEIKKKAKEELKKQAVSNAPTAAAFGAKGAGVGAIGFGLIKGVGFALKTAKGLLSTAPAVFVQQVVNLGGKAVAGVTGLLNGAVNSVLSVLKIGVTVSGIAPTVIASTMLVSSIGGGVIIATSGAAGGKYEEEFACTEPTDEKGSESANVEGIDANADYTIVGSDKYNLGKLLFDNFTETNGWSGAGAAGGIGNAIRESRLDPKADNTDGGVHGIFQWGGWSSEKNGDRWKSAPGGKVDTIENQIALLNFELRTGYKIVNTKVGRATDYKIAAEKFAAYFEQNNPEHFNPVVTYAGAKWAYEEFGGANIQANESVLNAPGESNDEIQIEEQAKEDNCEDENGFGRGAEDGTGQYTSSAVKPYIPKDLPKDLQKYAYDPRAVGLAYGKPDGWLKPGGQCVHLASSYFAAIWGIKETPFGNGHELARNWSALVKGELSNTPKKGAITGIPGAVPGISTEPHGHTNVVQHVFENGDILVVEQNFPNVTGDSGPIERGGTGRFTWHYSVIPKDIYIKYNFDFFVPTEKYKLNMGKNTIS